ncbi:hypothetical protein EHQ12_08575 [Leptospira gomenensis]|uniref:Uncharacterized protein n=1 Tax=Leptospira gomenensis TaxID=2484974 RepID=A0A5F1YBR4_9LEPT|nr:hypothetical protein [Leptospira gomenensis]TGK33827.1 hypothetical protein EHQ17_09985 [Leptospira gomenensis]TGK39951.1 hypothetical protein EHQ12_08575 [Leptospira gomenensis]TGK44957.1 hypothetical protein EHQ07_10995 [Leptospira gomenensis]TGK59899.1 hypothetical protein EHQ13_11775 [Leptospira gomenensis]
MNFKRIACFAFFCVVLPLFPLPVPPSLESQVKNSDYIALSRITNVREKKISETSVSVTATVEVLKPWKGAEKLPAKFEIGFMIFPEFLGKWLRAAPPEGDYVLFFIQKTVKDSKGNESQLIALYEPHPFAFKEYTRETEDKIREIVQDQK